MIAVIADDFTGAAEIGGVGLKYGFNVVIGSPVGNFEDADLLVVVANTRSLNEKDAFSEIKIITKKLLADNPDYIFKKQDSVLRGNIATELIAQLNVTGKKKVIMIAGNPSLGRIIKKGIYTVNGVPLAKTSFADDPDFPVKSSFVTDIVKSGEINVVSLPVNAVLPNEGIIIGDVCNYSEMGKWAEIVSENMVVAGGAGFFDVMLSKKYTPVLSGYEKSLAVGNTALFIFGSKFPKAELLPCGLTNRTSVKVNMPDEIYDNAEFDYKMLEKWAIQIISGLRKKKKVIVTVEQKYSKDPNISERIRQNIGELVELIIGKVALSDLVIEGGATTFDVLKAMNIKKLFPDKTLAQGIIQMKTDDYPEMTITTKPGSYPWPDVVESV